MSIASFPALSSYGNYEFGKVPRGVHQISMDGTIRLVKKRGIPFVEVITIDNPYGSHYFPKRVGYAILSRDKRRLDRALQKHTRDAASRLPSPQHDLLLCIREASRAAHRERDAAQIAYQQGRHTLAGNAKRRKDKWYCLKDRGIVTAHRQGLLRYVGVSPQGLAVYEYGEGGMCCFHSTLHPVGAERRQVEGHPETLLVPAKNKVRGVSLLRVETTLTAVPEDLSGYERSAPPRIERERCEYGGCVTREQLSGPA
jgi:hypothetical protein